MTETPTEGPGKSRRVPAWAGVVLKYMIGFGLLVWVVSANWSPREGSADPGLGALVRGPVNLPALAGCGLLLTLAVGVQFLRWHVLARALAVPVGLRDTVRLSLVGAFYNTFLPGSVGGDVVRAYGAARNAPGRRAAAVASVAVDRVVGLFAMILYAALVGGACWAAGDPRVADNPDLRAVVLAAAAVVAAGAAGWVVLGLVPDAASRRLVGGLAGIPKVGRAVAGLCEAVLAFRTHARAVALAVGLSSVAQAGLVGGFHFAARTFPPPTPGGVGGLAEHFVVVPVGFIAQVFIPAPGGVGGGEAVYGWLYQDVLGKPAATGIAACLAVRLVLWLIGLVGYVVALNMRGPAPAAAPADAPPPGTGEHEAVDADDTADELVPVAEPDELYARSC